MIRAETRKWRAAPAPRASRRRRKSSFPPMIPRWGHAARHSPVETESRHAGRWGRTMRSSQQRGFPFYQKTNRAGPTRLCALKRRDSPKPVGRQGRLGSVAVLQCARTDARLASSSGFSLRGCARVCASLGLHCGGGKAPAAGDAGLSSRCVASHHGVSSNARVGVETSVRAGIRIPIGRRDKAQRGRGSASRIEKRYAAVVLNLRPSC